MEKIIQVCAGVVLALAIYMFPIFSSGSRDVGRIETIHGIGYPKDGQAVIVEEKLAHGDVFLQEPVLGKQLTLTISFEPGNTKAIDIGVREGGFWFGYAKQPLYRSGVDLATFQTKQIRFPLSTAFQDKDRSIDTMLFSTTSVSTADIEEQDHDSVSWKIYSYNATVTPHAVSYAEVKSYLRSIFSRERAL